MLKSSISGFVIVAALLVLAAPAMQLVSARTQNENAGTFDRTIVVQGRERTYRVHVPNLPSPATGLPVLIVLHGGGGNGSQMEKKTGFYDLAERDGFIAVYPNGTGRLTNRFTWDAHNCCAYAYSQRVDDVGFISSMIDQLIAEFDVDPTRIYVTGHSNGAMMTYRLGCELAGKIAAIAPYGGALNTDTCAPSRPLPVLVMHGEDDKNVPVEGGRSPGVGVPSEDDRVDQPLTFAVDSWVSIDNCDAAPSLDDTTAAIISTYNSCASGTEVESVVIHEWDHRWPSTNDGAPIDAATLIWNFVSRFSSPPA